MKSFSDDLHLGRVDLATNTVQPVSYQLLTQLGTQWRYLDVVRGVGAAIRAVVCGGVWGVY